MPTDITLTPRIPHALINLCVNINTQISVIIVAVRAATHNGLFALLLVSLFSFAQVEFFLVGYPYSYLCSHTPHTYSLTAHTLILIHSSCTTPHTLPYTPSSLLLQLMICVLYYDS